MTLTKKDILSRSTRIVYVNSLEGELNFIKIPARIIAERDNKTNEEISFDILAASIVDDKGKQMFTVDEVKSFPLDVFTELSKIVSDINNIKVQESESLKNALTEGSTTS